ncbi:hypothetical protein ACFQ36_22095 [Arthrobacter sp. GCM10027362]|uniref:hypothetical protein n=1 Tax=Arthrobacter sp. GCM10027362 TaxID=3273379 RepID=UPI0036444B0C
MTRRPNRPGPYKLWEPDRVFADYLPLRQKLIEKYHHGAKVTRNHDVPATPAKTPVRIKSAVNWTRNV